MAEGRHIVKRRFGHNTAADCLFLPKFCVKMQNLRLMTVECENVQNLEIQDGGQLPCESSPDFDEILQAGAD